MDLKNIKIIERNFVLNKIQNFEIFGKADVNFLDKIINDTDFDKSIFYLILREKNLKF